MNNHKLILSFYVGLVTDSELENMINRVEEHIREAVLQNYHSYGSKPKNLHRSRT